MNFLISLTETDKRVIFAILLLIILLFVIIGYLGLLVTRVMAKQGKKIDELTHDVLVTKVITDKDHFASYARKKNWILFFKQSYIPLIILLFGILVLIIRNAATNDWAYDLLDYKKTGFNTLFFIWDFGNIDKYTTKVLFMTLLRDWPDTLSTPHFSAEAWASYIFFFSVMIGGIWYLLSVQRVIARTLRIRKLKESVFSKKLDNFNLYQSSNNFTDTNNQNNIN